MHLREPAPPPSRCAAGIPPAVDELVLRCLAKDPEERPTAGELATTITALFQAPRRGGSHGRASAPFSGMVHRPAMAAVGAARRRAWRGLAIVKLPVLALPITGLAVLVGVVGAIVWLALVVLGRFA
jgi:hypothetical protein